MSMGILIGMSITQGGNGFPAFHPAVYQQQGVILILMWFHLIFLMQVYVFSLKRQKNALSVHTYDDALSTRRSCRLLVIMN